ncbi:M15 family metallopeptidase [Arsenicicoccus bolidensis]|uniref:M15 family metallopeptidase n=2 Tax=Arsenicicoccus bolidensis TaxID=229480 RepID=A0ABS9Q4Q0_9MICO|nr:M15 family metallopeptidase [Arsenicicoccus bolidensis]
MAAVLVPAAGALGVAPSAWALAGSTPAPAPSSLPAGNSLPGAPTRPASADDPATAAPTTSAPTTSAPTTSAPTSEAPGAPVGAPTSTTPPAPPPSPRPTAPRTHDSQQVRVSLQCAGCGGWDWVAGVGQTRVVGMVLPARAGTPVRILRKAPGAAAYVQVATATTGTSGAFSWTGPMGAVGTSSYQAVVEGAPASAQVARAVVAPSVTMTVPPATDTLKNPPVTGVVSPRIAGIRVRTEVLTPAGWRTSQIGTTRAGGAFTLPLTYGQGTVGVVTVRTAITVPNGVVAASPSRGINRVAVMDPVVRGTVAADVPRTHRAGCPVGPASLRTIDMNHWGFDGRIHRGRLVIRTANVTPILNSFQTAFNGRFPIREMRDASVYGGDDIISMEHDNTNGFNCRRVTGNPYRMSPHSYGTSVDINTVENPYRIPSGVWLPKNGQAYVARTPYRPGMLTPSTPFTKALLGNGFTWLSGFDWQHFQR